MQYGKLLVEPPGSFVFLCTVAARGHVIVSVPMFKVLVSYSDQNVLGCIRRSECM